MNYPSRQDIDRSVQNLDSFIRDPMLFGGVPIRENHRLVKYSGGYSMVYPIDTTSGKYALRCWYSSIGDAKERYQQIDQYLRQSALPYFVDFNYVEKGIVVNGLHWDIIRMEWVEALDLKEYLGQILHDPIKIRELAHSFLLMVRSLHQLDIAHGDLQHGNILVNEDGQIFLVDYDSLYVPSFTDELDLVKGLKGYQHPARFSNCEYSHSKIDYFSELVIYLSLLAISEDPALWYTYEVKDSLDFLFNRDDFIHPVLSPAFKDLNGKSDLIRELNNELIGFCGATDISDLDPLEVVLERVLSLLGIDIGPPEVDGNPAAEELIRSFEKIVISKPNYKEQETANSIILKMNNP